MSPSLKGVLDREREETRRPARGRRLPSYGSSGANCGACSVGAVGNLPLKTLVGPVAQLGHGPEVGRERDDAGAAFGEARAHAVVDVDVGAREAVDGLFGVADDKERAGVRRSDGPRVRGFGSKGPWIRAFQERHDLGLDGVRVLELVHEDPAVLVLQRAAHVGVVAEHAGREQQQVVEAEDVAAPALFGGARPRLGEHVDREPVEILAPGRQERADDLGAELVRERVFTSLASDLAASRPSSPIDER